VALNGNDGFAMAQPGAFDLLLLDWMLPDLSGLEIARRLHARLDRTPILMLTARDSIRDIVHGLDLGADDCATASLRTFLPRRRGARQRQRQRIRTRPLAGHRRRARNPFHEIFRCGC
jgi:OmpR-family two-component system manganese-sensing response regulator